MSTRQLMAVLVAMKASLESPALMRKAARRAPWWPLSPPKKPLSRPPRVSQVFEEIDRGVERGKSSSRAKNNIKAAMTDLTRVISAVLEAMV